MQKKYITRLKGYNNTDQLCDRESLLTDLPKSWSHKELLHNRSGLINHEDKIIPVTYKEFYILSRPLKAMAQWKIQYMLKEVYILSGPSKLQPVTDYITQYTQGERPTPTAEHLRSSRHTQRASYSHKPSSHCIMQTTG